MTERERDKMMTLINRVNEAWQNYVWRRINHHGRKKEMAAFVAAERASENLLEFAESLTVRSARS